MSYYRYKKCQKWLFSQFFHFLNLAGDLEKKRSNFSKILWSTLSFFPFFLIIQHRNARIPAVKKLKKIPKFWLNLDQNWSKKSSKMDDKKIEKMIFFIIFSGKVLKKKFFWSGFLFCKSFVSSRWNTQTEFEKKIKIENVLSTKYFYLNLNEGIFHIAWWNKKLWKNKKLKMQHFW